ncbi:MAG: ArsC/Spx/MgsR family protein [Pseudomonadota bacterium]
MALTLYGLKTCDTCRKALKALNAAGRDVTFADIRETPLPLEAWLDTAGAYILVNKRSTTWRGLSETERAQAPNIVLETHRTLIKRPVITRGNEIFVGWTPAVQKALLGD